MATLEQLLLALSGDKKGLPPPAPSAPIPLAPTGNLGPLRDDTSAAYGALNPEPAPPSFIQPAAPNQGFVDQYAGQAPTAPVERRPGKLETILAVIGGVGAGLNGQGAEYVEGIRRRRNEPFEKYEREQRGYEERRTRGLELAERRAEREAEQANRANELLYEREFKGWLAKNSNRDDESKERMRQAFILERDATAQRLQADREQQREQRQRQVDAKQIAGRYFTVSRNYGLSQELGAHYAGVSDKPLSPAAARLDAQLADITQVRMQRASGVSAGGGKIATSSAAQKALDSFNAVRQQVIAAIQRGDKQSEKAYREAMNRAFKSLSRFPRDIEIGTGDGWPYAKPRESAPAPAQQQQQAAPDPLGVR